MPSRMRRSMLTIAAGTSITYLAGCTDIIANDSDTVELCAVGIQNRDEVFENDEDGNTYHAELQVVEDDEIVAEEAGDIVPYDDNSDESSGIVITADELDSNEGAFSVRARIDGGDWEEENLPDVDVNNDDDPVVSDTTIEYGSLRSFHTHSYVNCDY